MSRRHRSPVRVEEVERVRRHRECSISCRLADGRAGDQRQRRVALAFDRRLTGDESMRAIGGDEVDDRGFVLEMAGEIDPALIRLEQRILVGRLVELRRAALSDGTPVSRPRARLMVARSSGRPSRLLRSALVTNSSIWLPT